jgi:hypothetical protein
VSSKKELVVIGDSFCIDYIKMRNHIAAKESAPYLLHDRNENKIKEFKWDKKEAFPIWGEIVAKELNLKLVNLGQSGTGTNYVFAELLDYLIINKKNIKMIIISWSGHSRFDFQLPSGMHYPVHHPKPWLTINAISPQSKLLNNELFIAAKNNHALTFEVGLNSFFRHAYVLQNLLESYGIDYRMIQSVSDGFAFEKDKYNKDGMIKYAKAIINNPYFDLINDEKFIGCPGTLNLGGFTMADIIWTEDDKNHISNMDHHPNKNGMKIIAKVILDDLQQTI